MKQYHTFNTSIESLVFELTQIEARKMNPEHCQSTFSVNCFPANITDIRLVVT